MIVVTNAGFSTYQRVNLLNLSRLNPPVARPSSATWIHLFSGAPAISGPQLFISGYQHVWLLIPSWTIDCYRVSLIIIMSCPIISALAIFCYHSSSIILNVQFFKNQIDQYGSFNIRLLCHRNVHNPSVNIYNNIYQPPPTIIDHV